MCLHAHSIDTLHSNSWFKESKIGSLNTMFVFNLKKNQRFHNFKSEYEFLSL